MAKEVFHSIGEMHEKFYPNRTLEDLASEAGSELCPKFIRGYSISRVSTNKSNPKMGLIEITKPPNLYHGIEKLSDVVKRFYTKRGFEVKQQENYGMIIASKDKEIYWISIFNHYSEFSIYISEGINFKNLAKN